RPSTARQNPTRGRLALDLDRGQADGVAERAVVVEGRQAGRVVEAVPADDQAVWSGWQVGRERDRLAVVQGRAGRPDGGRVAAVVRLGVALGDRAPVGADDVDEGLVGPAGHGVGAPEQVEVQGL